MRRLAAAAFVAGLLWPAPAWALEHTWSNDEFANSHTLRGLPAPAGDGTKPARLADVAVGACIPKWSGVNGTASCAVAGTDYAAVGSSVTSVTGTAARISSTGGTTPVLDLIATAVTPGSYTYGGFTVDAYGRLTAAASGATPALAARTLTGTSPVLIDGGTSGDFSANRTISLATNGIGNTLLRQGAGTSVVGVAGGSTANLADIAASADGQFLGRVGGALTWTSTVAATSVPLSGVTGVYSSSLGLGPTALGSAGSGTTLARSDITHAAYRSDSISTTWFVDPTNGSDAAANGCTSAATACASLSQVRRRLWGAEITTNTTITILGNLLSTDTGAWNVTVAPGIHLQVVGSLGATTGFGGAAIDNTLYTGTVTGFVAGSNTPAAQDIELTDTAIPTSFTASGLLASGVIVERTNGTPMWFYVLKDLGSKTARITVPQGNTVSSNMSNALTVTDTIAARQMWNFPRQNWGPITGGFALAAVPNRGNGQLQIFNLYETGGSGQGSGPNAGNYTPRRQRVWIATPTVGASIILAVANNCLFDIASSTSFSFGNDVPAGITSGGAKGSGSSVMNFFGTGGISSPFVSQGVGFVGVDRGYLAIEGPIAFHDLTIPFFSLTQSSRLMIGGFVPSPNGVSGVGNSGKMLVVDLNSASNGSSVVFGGNVSVPAFAAASTSDATPIQIGASTYTVAQLPADATVLLSGNAQFPSRIYETGANTLLSFGAVADGALVKRSGATLIGATAGTDYQAAGNYITALTGDGTAAGPGSAAFTIAADAVSYAKMQNVSAASRLLGRGSAGGAGDPQEISLGSGLSMSGTTLSATGGTVTNVTATLPLTSSGGATPDIALQYDNASITLNVGNGIQRAALTGDASAAAGANTLTLATVGGGAGSCTNCSVTFDAKGRQTAYSSGTAPVTAVTGTSGRISSSGGTTPAIDLVNTAVTPGSYTYGAFTVDAAGRLTAASSGAAPGPVGATYITQTADATLTNEVPLSGLASGMLASVTTTGALSTFAAGANRIPTGSGTNGKLTDAAELKLNGQTFGLGSVQEVQVYNTSASTSAIAGFRTGTDASFTNNFAFTMQGTNWTGGNRVANQGLVELDAGNVPLVISNLNGGSSADVNIATGTSRTVRVSIDGSTGLIETTVPIAIGPAATGAAMSLRNPDDVASYSQLNAYPNSGTNVGASLSVIPRGTGFSSTNKAQLSIFNTDFAADATNYELLSARSVGTGGFIIGTGKGGSGTNRDMMFAAGWMTNGTTNDGQLKLAANGNVSMVSLTNGLTRTNASGLLSTETIPGSNRVLAGNAAGTDFAASDEIRLDDATDQFMASNDGALVWRDMSGGSMIGATNYSQVRAAFTSNIWNLKSEKGGTGIVRPMKIDAGTATLTLTGANVAVATLTGAGNKVVTADSSGNLGATTSPTSATLAFDYSGLAIAATDTEIPAGISYVDPGAATHRYLLGSARYLCELGLNLITNSFTGGGSWSLKVQRQGADTGISLGPYSSGSTITASTSGVVSGSSGDVYSLVWTKTGTVNTSSSSFAFMTTLLCQ